MPQPVKLEFQNTPQSVVAELYGGNIQQMAIAKHGAYDLMKAALEKSPVRRTDNVLTYDDVHRIASEHDASPVTILGFLVQDEVVNDQAIDVLGKIVAFKEAKGLYKDVEARIIPALSDPNAVMQLARELATEQYNKIGHIDSTGNTNLFLRQGDLRRALRLTSPVTVDQSITNR